MYRLMHYGILSGLVALATISSAQAGSDRWVGPRGYPVQTWEDIARARQDIQRLIVKEYHYGNADAAGPKAVRLSHKRVDPR